jgi:mannosyltransferase OCH1-like enzyme
MNNLYKRNRSHKSSNDKVNQQQLPITMTNKFSSMKLRSNNLFRTKNDLDLRSLLTLRLLFQLIFAFLLYAGCMSWHNTRSIRDPCIVADTTKASLLSANPDNHAIPKIIHQQWKTETVPKKFMKWRQKWFDLYPQPEYQHMLWTDVNGRELIEAHYPWFLETYDGYEHNINRADAVRYFILHRYGGIYADLDYEPLVNFYSHLPQNQVGMVESPYYWNEKTQNCLMSSPKGDLFWEDLFGELVKNAKKVEVLEATGPILLDQAARVSSHTTHVLPCENFQRVPLGEYSETQVNTIIEREIMFRLKPISKHCGYYSDLKCQFGRHHNTVSYRTPMGRVL